jgi:PA-IL-like protein.
MLLKSKLFRAAAALSLVFCLCVLTLADTIRLKDGSVIKGKIIGFRDGQFVVAIGNGARARQMTFYADEVEAVEFDSSPAPVKISNQTTEADNSRPANNTGGANTVANSNPDSNVIIVGKGDASKNSTNPTPSYTNTLPVSSNTNTTPANTNSSKTGSTNQPPTLNTNPTRPKPIQLTVKVLADNTANGWTNAGWVVKKGQKIRITGRGQVNLGNGMYSKPEGIKSLPDKDKLIPSEPTGGLIAVIGDNNNDFIFIGASREFIAERDGMLFLGVNEGNLNDNSGAFDVTVEIEPMPN